MIKLIFEGIIRGFRKSKLDFFLNLIGLSIAMMVFICISIYVKDELSFDKYHKDTDQIYRLTTSITSPNGEQTNMALANTTFGHNLKNSFPEVEDIVCVDVGGDYNIKYGNYEFEHISIRAATPSVFNVFSYPVIEGSVNEFLKSPNTIVLTESLSKTIFRESPPLGKVITINKENYTVNGIIEDLPGNTDLQFSALMYSAINGTEELFDWGDYYVYCKLNAGNLTELTTKIDQLTVDKYAGLLEQMGGLKLNHNLQALQSIHFNNTLLADTPKGNKRMVYMFSGIAFLILIIATINYINLNIAQLKRRQKELSIRKIIGCGHKWILIHVLSESFLNFVLAAFFALSISILLLPFINGLFNKQFTGFSIFQQIIPLLLIFSVTGILSGIYPAYKIGKSETNKHLAFSGFGKFLVTFQNGISIIMIAAVLLLGKQVNFMKDHDLGLGLNKSQIVAINLPFDAENFPGTETISHEFSSLAEIESLAFGGGGTNLGATDNWMKAIMTDKDEQGNDVQFILNQPRIDENYINLFGIELLKGRNFSATITGDAEKSVIINEAYAKVMGWSEPIGKILDEIPPQKIIGLVENFHFDALNNPIEPLKFQMLASNNPSYLFLKTEPKNIKTIHKKWESLYADNPFDFQFVDQRMAQLYEKNEKEMTIFSYLTIIAILISCLGLYGLTSHFTANKTKEIGIRKVNGAKVSEILTMLNKDFIKWVAIAFIVACPIAWYAMNKWLENFAYKTTLSWWIFALAGVLALGIALLTVSFQSYKAATRNPVEALRYE